MSIIKTTSTVLKINGNIIGSLNDIYIRLNIDLQDGKKAIISALPYVSKSDYLSDMSSILNLIDIKLDVVEKAIIDVTDIINECHTYYKSKIIEWNPSIDELDLQLTDLD